MIPIEQAFQLIDEHVTRLPPTRLPLASSVGWGVWSLGWSLELGGGNLQL